MSTTTVLDVTDASFATEVVERSRDVPVVVDFWAPWCGPCRILGPILEKLAEEHAGEVQLVKLNTDENPTVAQQHQIQGIPAVFAYRDGKPVSQFVGALPEPQVREFFQGVLPSPQDTRTEEARRLLGAGQPGAAQEVLESVLAEDPNHQDAALALAALLVVGGAHERARKLAERWPADPRAKQILAALNLRRVAAGADADALRARLAADDADAEAHYRLGSLLALRREWEEALDHLLTAVRLERSLDDEGPRLRLLDAFAMLGDESPLTQDYRRRLGSVLF